MKPPMHPRTGPRRDPRPHAPARLRPHHLWLLTPFVLFLGVLPLVNRVEPVVLGLPFLFVWLLGATVLTPLAVWMTWRGDRRDGRAGGGERS